MVAGLKDKVGQRVLGVVGRGNAKAGKSAPWVLFAANDTQKEAAKNFPGGYLMRTGIAYGVAMSVGVLLGVFVDNLFWLIAVPAVLSALAIVSVVNTERQKSEEPNALSPGFVGSLLRNGSTRKGMRTRSTAGGMTTTGSNFVGESVSRLTPAALSLSGRNDVHKAGTVVRRSLRSFCVGACTDWGAGLMPAEGRRSLLTRGWRSTKPLTLCRSPAGCT